MKPTKGEMMQDWDQGRDEPLAFFIGLRNVMLMYLAAIAVGLSWIGFLWAVGFIP